MQQYQIRNTTRNTTLALHADRAASFLARLRGLMFRADLPQHSGMVIEPNNSVHTFWMRFPIDIVFVDRHDRVVGVVHAMPPNRPFAGARRAHRTVELPAGVIAATHTAVGDVLQFDPPQPA